MLYTVYYNIVISCKYYIAVLTHYLSDKLLTLEISHLIQMLYHDNNYTLEPRLINIHYPAIVDMFSEQHAEIRRSHRVFLCRLLKIYKRKTGIRRYQKSVILPIVFDNNIKLILFRLVYLVYPAIHKLLFHISNHIGYYYSVKSHTCLSCPEKRQKMQIILCPVYSYNELYKSLYIFAELYHE